jgi:hypothetical protein
MSTAGQYHFVNGVIKGVDDDYNSRMLKAVRDVTVDEIKKVMRDVLMPTFTPGVSNVVVTCAPIMEEVGFPFPSLAYGFLSTFCIMMGYWGSGQKRHCLFVSCSLHKPSKSNLYSGLAESAYTIRSNPFSFQLHFLHQNTTLFIRLR